MTSNYTDIYSRFLGKITDYKFATLPEADATGLMKEWLCSSLSDPYIRRLFSTIKFDDEIAVLDYQMVDGIEDDRDKDFVEEMLSLAMMIRWLKPQVESVTNIAQFFGGKEQKLRRHGGVIHSSLC